MAIWLRPDRATVDNEIEDIQSAMELEQNMASGTSVWDMFTNPVDRCRTILAVAAVTAVTTQAAPGAMFMIGKLRAFFFFQTLTYKGSLTNTYKKHMEPTSSKWPMSATHPKTAASSLR